MSISMRAQLQNTWNLPSGEWALSLLDMDGKFVVSSSSGKLYIFDVSNTQSEPVVIAAHDSSINAIVKIDNLHIASCSGDGIKVWDISSPQLPLKTLTNAKNSPFLSLTYANHRLAGGTELAGQDAEVHIWDLKKDSIEPVRSFIDSHHDDVTYLEFHPSLSQYLMSGSTDGYVNIYDLSQEDEEDALHQVINFASVHSCQFIQERRIAVLSHMETLGYFELNNQDYENAEEPQPKIIGDVRTIWSDCEYVIKASPHCGYVAYGANSQRKLTILPFDCEAELVDQTQPCWFPGAHDEEVVRDVLALNTNTILTCGEDGAIRSWVMPWELKYKPVVTETVKEVPAKKESHKTEKSKEEKKKKKKKEKKHRKKDVKFKPY